MLHLIPTPIGNLEDITLRALKLLDGAERVICEDTRMAGKLYLLLSQRGLISPKNRSYHPFHAHNQKQFFDTYSDPLFAAPTVYISDAGMPGISDPGSELTAYCHTKGIPFDVLPGANAALCAYVASGMGAHGFLFYGFLPHKGADRTQKLSELLWCGSVVVLYESPYRLQQLLEEIAQRDGVRTLFLAKELTKLHQGYFKGGAAALAEQFATQSIKGEWCVVLEAGSKPKATLGLEEIRALNLPPKALAKLEARILGVDAKSHYTQMLTLKDEH